MRWMSTVFTKVSTKTNLAFVIDDSENTYKNTYMNNIPFFANFLRVKCAMLPSSSPHQFGVHEKMH